MVDPINPRLPLAPRSQHARRACGTEVESPSLAQTAWQDTIDTDMSFNLGWINHYSNIRGTKKTKVSVITTQKKCQCCIYSCLRVAKNIFILLFFWQPCVYSWYIVRSSICISVSLRDSQLPKDHFMILVSSRLILLIRDWVAEAAA